MESYSWEDFKTQVKKWYISLTFHSITITWPNLKALGTGKCSLTMGPERKKKRKGDGFDD